MGKKVAVIGAGPSGLVALKTLHESGHDAVCFESLSEIGGLWNYDLHTNKQGETQGYVDLISDSNQPTQSSYKSLTFLTLSHTSMFSDFVPEDMDLYKVAKYMCPKEYFEYLKKYAEFYNLYRYINFNSHVVQVQKSSSTFSPWKVTYERNENQHDERFDFVFIASGVNTFPHKPRIENIHKFKCLVIHSSQVRNEEALFPGKRVLVVGGRFSGSDMIVNALRHKASKIYWTVGRNWEKNQWCLDRFVAVNNSRQRQPWQAFLTRFELDIKGINTTTLTKLFVPIRQKSKQDKPKLGDPFTVNDSTVMTKAVENQEVTFVPTVSYASQNGETVHFSDDSSVSDIDIIILATGFSRKFPFLKPIWSTNEQTASLLYKFTICPKTELDGLAFIGYVQGAFANSLVAEMQCKWLCNTMLAKFYNPDGILYNECERKYMETYISKKPEGEKVIYDPYGFLDNLYSEIGFKVPSLNELLKKNEIEMAVALYHGPLLGAHYCLSGEKGPCFEKAKKYLITVAKVILEDDFHILVEQYRRLAP